MTKPKIKDGAGGFTLDVVAIVHFFGGRAELVRQMEQHGIDVISPDAVNKWQQRGIIPGGRLMDLTTLAALQKRRFTIGNYIRRPNKPKKKAA